MKTIKGWEIETKEDVKLYAKEIEDMEGRDTRHVKKVKSDEEYDKVMPVTQKQKEISTSSRGLSLTDEKSPAQTLLKAISSGSIKNETDNKLAYDVAHELIQKIAEYNSKKSQNPYQVSR